jgi:acetolactate synthase small subunit
MQAFHIQYRNTQGTLMRILNAASRRGLDMPYVQATPIDHEHAVTLLLEVNPKQTGQLCRDWHAIVDVTKVRAGVPFTVATHAAGEWTTPHLPASVRAAANTAARTASA